MADKKSLPKILSWLEIVLAAIAAFAGAALAVVCLVFKPVVIAANPAAVRNGGSDVVYYAQGSRDRAKGATWVRKRAALLAAAPGVISINEDELNTWFASSTHTRPPRRAGGAASAIQLDFRIDNNLLQVAAPVTVQTPLGARTLIVQLRGIFERIPANPGTGMAGLVMYAPREAYAGSLPLHRIPGATARLIGGLLESQTPPAEALAAWRKIERVTINGRELLINISNIAE